ncbi:protein VAC14 homolog [Frankliniella occidentalis]|uniref:Protein VAC14 homolog n=1 Tax=Frankliniella occidentalis TaxID=133901 RepID=A0A9C6U032_FRAOC|nr:protein VAC14 homolog [Frankliniella occidentalis]
MSEKEYAPLSSACVRALNDKIYDKRKAAALEIEKMVKDFVTRNRSQELRQLIKVLGQDFAGSQNPNTRKGGLIGLAATAIALGKDTGQYTQELILPILACFSDSDSRVRYYACESLYNVVKVARGAVLPHFAEIFSALSKLAADPEQNVKNASELLDRLMKDIVSEDPSFNMVGFMELLRERIYSRNAFTRQFIISWVSVLYAVPDMDFIVLLPEILDGLLRMLDEPTLEIKKTCDTVLGEFLRSIKQDPSRVDFPMMINILIVHSQAQDEFLQLTAITWIKEFVQLSGRNMLPFASGILTAILPCLSYDTDSRKNIRETAKAVNFILTKLITDEKDNNESGDDLNLPSIIDVLQKHLVHSAVPTKVAALQWVYHLHTNIPDRMLLHVDELFTVLLKVLSDSADEVVQQDIEVLAEFMSYPSSGDTSTGARIPNSKNPYFSKFIVSLLKLFSTDHHLLEDRGSFIIRQLCVLLDAEDIYRTLATILTREENLSFAPTMVDTLNTILLTAAELFELRNKLKELSTKESCSLFCQLYELWCNNPVATVSLCLLTQNYAHASRLIRNFGGLEVTVEFLIEIDRLVQLLESPIFTFVRLELLEIPHNQHLVQALYGLLMLLPQTEAFHMLRRRLNCIPTLHLQNGYVQGGITEKPDTRPGVKEIDFDKLLKQFLEIQEKHQKSKQKSRKIGMLQQGVSNMDIQ